MYQPNAGLAHCHVLCFWIISQVDSFSGQVSTILPVMSLLIHHDLYADQLSK